VLFKKGEEVKIVFLFFEPSLETMTTTINLLKGMEVTHASLPLKSEYEVSRYITELGETLFTKKNLISQGFGNNNSSNRKREKTRLHEMTIITLQHKKKIMMSCE
jgi:hypothetical protein